MALSVNQNTHNMLLKTDKEKELYRMLFKVWEIQNEMTELENLIMISLTQLSEKKVE